MIALISSAAVWVVSYVAIGYVRKKVSHAQA